MSKLSIIIPVLDEGERIAATLDSLADMRTLGTEVIVVDGGSRDATIQRARLRADHVLKASRGRALQMNTGAEIAAGDVLLFLHANTRLPDAADHLVLDGLARSNRVWGRFDVGAANGGMVSRLHAAFLNLRSRLTGIASGDQAIFVQREVFRSVGGFPPVEAMEDRALCRRLKQVDRPLLLRERVTLNGSARAQ
jgi:rSAM/selenodomain-associated transferase 2